MSRARRQTPIRGITTCRSERADKMAWHRRYPRAVRQMQLAGDEESLHAGLHRAYSDIWAMG